jgi:hypothetical protein
MEKLSNVVLGFVVATFLVLTLMCFSAQASPIDPFIEKGFIAVEIDAKYYISDIVWNASNYKTKSNLVLACAIHHEEKTGARRATVYSMSSGKLIGKYNVFGVKLY